MDVAIISTGDELTAGELVDGNSAYLAERMTRLGADPVCQITVGDDRDRLVWAISQASQMADLVIITGGLGPTRDDLTRYALAEFAGVELEERHDVVQAIEAFFQRRGRSSPAVNRVQALIPAGADVLDNPVGTAPGIHLHVGATDIFALPGVPREMKTMFVNHVEPWVCERSSPRIHRIRLQCVGTGESNIMQQIEDLVGSCETVRFGTRAAEGIISIKLSSTDRAVLDDLAGRIRQRLGPIVFGQGEQSLSEVVGDLLRAGGQTLAVAESCTGGWIGKLITDVPGSSDYFLGGWQCYSNAFKQRHLSVGAEVIEQHGAVSERCAQAMLDGLLDASGADWGLAVTGIAGPGGGTIGKPVGLVYVAVGNRRDRRVTAHRFGDLGREAVRYRAAITALNTLRLMLLDGK